MSSSVPSPSTNTAATVVQWSPDLHAQGQLRAANDYGSTKAGALGPYFHHDAFSHERQGSSINPSTAFMERNVSQQYANHQLCTSPHGCRSINMGSAFGNNTHLQHGVPLPEQRRSGVAFSSSPYIGDSSAASQAQSSRSSTPSFGRSNNSNIMSNTSSDLSTYHTQDTRSAR